MMDRSSEAQRLRPEGELAPGTIVCDVMGEKIGEVTVSALADGYFVIKQGWLFTHELYLPASTITRQDATTIGLNLHKEELKQEQWRHPPSDEVLANQSAQPIVGPGTPGMLPGSNEGSVSSMPPAEDNPPQGNG